MPYSRQTENVRSGPNLRWHATEICLTAGQGRLGSATRCLRFTFPLAPAQPTAVGSDAEHSMNEWLNGSHVKIRREQRCHPLTQINTPAAIAALGSATGTLDLTRYGQEQVCAWLRGGREGRYRPINGH
jgi:hypothetical protein